MTSLLPRLEFDTSSTLGKSTTFEPRNTTNVTEATRVPTATVSDATLSTMAPDSDVAGPRFPFPVVMIVLVWVFLALAYMISRWRQKGKSIYIIPRVFVLCSPRTVQFHYELILRIGLPSYDFNPDKHDIDLTVQGAQKNEVVPITRLNTKTLLDEPLITSVSIVVYRLVEMPPLGSLLLKHSGPFKSWVYAYDFTVIDLATNKEQYYTLNQYIGSLNRVISLNEQNSASNTVQYPIDDVPLPHWSLEDVFLFLYTVINGIMLKVTLMPINCNYANDVISVFLTAFGAGALVFFLDWFLYYHLKWNQERREYFNEYETSRFCVNEFYCRIGLAIIATIVGFSSIYFSIPITDWQSSLVWLLAVVNSTTLVIGFWNVARQVEFGESVVALGLRMRGIEMVSVGMRYSEMVSELHSKSGSASDDGPGAAAGSRISTATSGLTLAGRSFGPRSSVKSFGFDPRGHHILGSKFPKSRASSTGATPNTRLASEIIAGGRRATAAGGARQTSPDTAKGSAVSTVSSTALPPPGISAAAGPEASSPKSASRSHSSSESERRRKAAAAAAASASGSSSKKEDSSAKHGGSGGHSHGHGGGGGGGGATKQHTTGHK